MTDQLKDLKHPLNVFLKDWLGVSFDSQGRTFDGVSCLNLIYIYFVNYKQIPILSSVRELLLQDYRDTIKKPAFCKKIIQQLLKDPKFNMCFAGPFLPEDIVIFNEMHGGLLLTEYIFIHSSSSERSVVLDDIRVVPEPITAIGVAVAFGGLLRYVWRRRQSE